MNRRGVQIGDPGRRNKSMKKVHVTICAGTACYVLGGAELLGAIDSWIEKWGEQVEFEGTPCLGFCKSAGEAKAPYVLVNGLVVEHTTAERLEEMVNSALLGTEEEAPSADAAARPGNAITRKDGGYASGR